MTLERPASLRGLKVLGRRRSKPIRLSFSGLDGAGKSFQIEALLSSLGQDRTVEVIWVPFKFWARGVKDLLPRRLRRRLRPSERGVVEEPSRARTPSNTQKRNGIRTAAEGLPEMAAHALRRSPWAVTGTMAALSTGLSLRQRVSAGKADVVVLDRYRLDSSVKIQWQFPGVAPSWLAGIVRAVTPDPDLEVLLRIDPAEAYARKAEQWSLSQLSEHARLYDRLAAGSRRVLTVDAEQAPEEVARQIWARVRPLLDQR